MNAADFLSHLRKNHSEVNILNLLKDLIPFLIVVFLFFIPFPHTTAIKEIAFYLSVLITLVLAVGRNIHFDFSTPLSLPFALLLGWAGLGIVFALNRENTAGDIYAHLIKYLALFFLIYNFFGTRRRLVYLIWIVIASAAVFSIWGPIYFYGTLGNNISTKFGLERFTEVPSNIIGICTIPGILFSLNLLSRGKTFYLKIILLLCLLAASAVTILTQTRSAFFAVLVSLGLVLPRNRKTMLPLILILSAMVIFLPIKDRLKPEAIEEKLKGDNRIKIIYTYFEMVKDYPITGIGFGMQTYYDEGLLTKYNTRVPEKYRQSFLHKAPHNLLVDVTVRLGFVGLAIYLYIFFIYSRMTWTNIRHGKDDFIQSWSLCSFAAFMSYFIIGMFENVASGPPALVLHLLFAMTAILWKLRKEAAEASISKK